MLLKLIAHAFRDQMHRQSRSVRRCNRAWFAKLRHAGQQFALDFQVFRHDLDNPIRLGAACQVVFEIPDDNLVRQRRREKGRGL